MPCETPKTPGQIQEAASRKLTAADLRAQEPSPPRETPEDRSKLPPGLELQWESGWPYPEIDVTFIGEGNCEQDAIAAARAFIDRIRQEAEAAERERLAKLAEANPDWGPDPSTDAPWVGRMIAAWLRAGGKGEP